MIFSSQTAARKGVSAALKSVVMGGAFLVAMSGEAHAIDITPNLALGATGWSTDRYDPSSFANVGNFAGRNNVLGIGISTADGAALRPPAFAGTFYNTQGKIQALNGAPGSTIAADLYIDSAWSDVNNGNVNTGLWSGTTDGTRTISDPYSHRIAYPRIGFTNFGAAGARLRVSDDSVTDGWVNLSTTVNYGSWMALSITLTTSNSIVYAVNGVTVYTDSSIDRAGTQPVGFSDVYLQAYNFNDASVAGAVGGNYTAHWTNTVAQPVPEPETYALMLAGLLSVGAVVRRRRLKNT